MTYVYDKKQVVVNSIHPQGLVGFAAEYSKTLRFGAPAPKIGAVLEIQESWKNLNEQANSDDYRNRSYHFTISQLVTYLF
jgi:hypothetical protein